MTDAYYRERMARRNRWMALIAALILLPVIVYLVGRAIYYDNCTGGFDRSPEAVVRSLLEMIRQGNRNALTRCWDNQAYYDLEAGCSEICLQRVLGAPYEVVEVHVGEPTRTEAGRLRLAVGVTIACPGGQRQTGEATLDTVGANLPWRHWKVIHSTLGGSIGQLWCK